MNDTIALSGTVDCKADCLQARLVREVAYSHEAVWHMLTQPAALVDWLAPGTLEPRTGGAIRLAFEDSGTPIDGTVHRYDPPSLLEYSWSSGDDPQRPIRWELIPIDAGTRMILAVRIPADNDIAKSAAGWEAHLEMLLATLEGVPIRFPVDLFLEARRR